MQDRRKFLKQTCTACVAVVGFGAILAELESCKTTTGVLETAHTIVIPVKNFEDKNTLMVDNPKVEYKILLVKKSPSEFVALKMVCTHKWNPVLKETNALVCPSHGSEFDLEGNVTKGPARMPLNRLPVNVQKGSVVISI